MGSPYEDGCILPVARGASQKGQPVSRGTGTRTPRTTVRLTRMSRRLLLPPLALLALLAAAPLAEARPAAKLTVMTRNVYLGGNIALPIPARTREEFEQKATQLWQEVQ